MGLRSLVSSLLPALVGSCTMFGCADESRVKSVERRATGLSQWTEEGFVELVPPVRPPTSADGSDRITVWARFPEGARITTESTSGEPRLRMPVGAELDRVEVTQLGDASSAVVDDVRGTEFGAEGEIFHVFRRRENVLWGLEWPRGDSAAQSEADQRLAAGLPQPMRHRLVKLNQCAGCHSPDKAPSGRATENELPHRKTDASGLYHPQSVLEQESPVEFSRPHDPNLSDPFVRMRCVTGELTVREERGAKSPRCTDGTVPLAKLDIPGALAKGDEHARAVCASRAFLWEHLDEAGRETFSAAFMECGIGPRGNHELSPNRLDDGLVMLLDEGHRYDGQFVGPEGHRYEHLGGDGRLGWIPERA